MAKRQFPGIGLTGGYAPGDDGWGDEQNANLIKVSAITQGGVLGRVAAVPTDPAPAQGDMYVLTAAPNANAVALYDNGAWTYIVPAEGWLFYDRGADKYISFDGAVWGVLQTGGGGLADAPTDGKLYGRKNGAWTEVVVSGGGGGSSLEIASTKPLAANFTWQNAGTATAVDRTLGMALRCPTLGSSTLLIRFLQYTGATLPATWIMTYRWAPSNMGWGDSYLGAFIARNSSNGKLVISGMYRTNRFLVQRWTNYNTYNSDVYNPTNAIYAPWQRVEKTANSLIFSCSYNGEEWYAYWTEPIATWLVAPDQFGIGMLVNNTDANYVLQSFSVVAT